MYHSPSYAKRIARAEGLRISNAAAGHRSPSKQLRLTVYEIACKVLEDNQQWTHGKTISLNEQIFKTGKPLVNKWSVNIDLTATEGAIELRYRETRGKREFKRRVIFARLNRNNSQPWQVVLNEHAYLVWNYGISRDRLSGK